MSRNRVFMNETKPSDPAERAMWEQFELMAGVRPLDGTNLEWIYNRTEEEMLRREGKYGNYDIDLNSRRGTTPGKELRDGISAKCRDGHHSECTSIKCQCSNPDCLCNGNPKTQTKEAA